MEAEVGGGDIPREKCTKLNFSKVLDDVEQFRMN